jgi:hypothetical protein
MPDSDDAPSDLLRERAVQNRVRLWFVLGADRRLVTGLLLAVVFLALLLTGLLSPAAESALRGGDSVDTFFQAMLTATITGVTLVLTLNQLVLSQEFGALGDQRERMEEAMQFRRDVGDVIGASVSPARPAQFLQALVRTASQRARDLEDAVSDAEDASLSNDVEFLTTSIVPNAQKVFSDLEDAQFGEFTVIAAALNFNYSWKIFTARRIREQHSQALDEDQTGALDRLIQTLQRFGSAREHFKTLYFQWDLINLSRHIMIASVPALVVSGVMILFFDSSTYSVVVFGVETVVAVTAVAATLSLSPFLILIAYVLRIATVTKRTLSVGSFILRETEDVSEVDIDDPE